MILLIDNYDSFTFNLYQYVEELGSRCEVIRNDKISLNEIQKMTPSAIILSPGPGRPDSSGICPQVITHFAGNIPILGVCLGHQAIGEAFGASVVRAKTMMHGKTSEVFHKSRGIYAGVSNPFSATRYHSLVIDPNTIPDCLEVTSHTHDGVIMGVRHKRYPIEGIQFHPESVMTTEGKKLLGNFLEAIAK